MKQSAPTLKRRLFASPARRAPAVPPAQPFHAFIAYADLAAARRAMGTIDEVLRAAGGFALKPMLWRFDQLLAAKWCDHALCDAGNAQVVVLANTATGPLPPAIEDWVSRLLRRKRGHRLTLVSLQGEDEAWTISIEASPTQLAALPADHAEKPLVAAAA